MTQTTTQANYDALDEKLRAVADTAAQAVQALVDSAAEPPGAEALAQAVSAAMLGGHPLVAVAAAEDIGRKLASESLRPEAIKRLKSTAAKKQQADQAVEAAITHAAAVNLSVREIATLIGVAAGTVKRVLEQPRGAGAHQGPPSDEAQPAAAIGEPALTTA